MGSYAPLICRRPIKMSLLCQIEMTLPGGFTELAYGPSVLKRARSNKGSGFVGWRIGRRASAALRRGSAPARRPTRTIVTSLSGRDGDISIWRTQTGPEDRVMTFDEMVAYLLETYPSGDYRGDELMDHITAEIKAAE